MHNHPESKLSATNHFNKHDLNFFDSKLFIGKISENVWRTGIIRDSWISSYLIPLKQQANSKENYLRCPKLIVEKTVFTIWKVQIDDLFKLTKFTEKSSNLRSQQLENTYREREQTNDCFKSKIISLPHQTAKGRRFEVEVWRSNIALFCLSLNLNQPELTNYFELVNFKGEINVSLILHPNWNFARVWSELIELFCE